MIKLVKCNLAGQAVGEDSPSCKYPDDLVAQARHLYDQGWTLKAISAELGPAFQSIHDWVKNRRRKPPARVIARRVRSESFVANHQQASADPASMRVPGHDAPAHTAKNTDIEQT